MGAFPTSPMPKSLDIPGSRPHWWVRFVRWVAESRSHRVICLVVVIWLLNWFDLTLTLLSYKQGMLHEENPFARHLLERGELSVMAFKVGLVLIGSIPLIRFRRARITELGALVVMFAYLFLAIRWSACLEIYTLTTAHPVNLAEIDAIIGDVPH